MFLSQHYNLTQDNRTQGLCKIFNLIKAFTLPAVITLPIYFVSIKSKHSLKSLNH